MHLLLFAAASCGHAVAHAETDFYDITCRADAIADRSDSGDMHFSMSIASGNATIDATTSAPIQVAMYENAFVWNVDGTDMMLDRFTARLTKSVRGPGGKRIGVGLSYRCEKTGGKLIQAGISMHDPNYNKRLRGP